MSTTKRLGGKKIALPDTGQKLDRVFTYTLSSMEEAAQTYATSWEYRRAKLSNPEVAELARRVPGAMMTGDAAAMPAILEGADSLGEEAVALDPRLGARPGWVRAVEGVELDAGLLAAGEEACCFDRRRRRQSEQTPSGEAVRLVISTDTKDISPAAASAFIAAARLASQFAPLEVWWQGSWLLESGKWQGNGHVFHVPLVRAGEMDFSRLQFVLCSPLRDHASFCVMFRHAFPAGLSWGAGQMKHSLLPNTRDFIPASGIRASGRDVAERAARWAGLESLWFAECEASRNTAQTWNAAPATAASRTLPAWEPSAEDRARWAKQDADAQAAKSAAARTRAGELF